MARPRTGRGTILGGGPFQAPTVATYPSGVTITNQGIEYSSGSFVTTTQLGYLASQNSYVAGGTTVCSGSTISLSHGLTTLTSLTLTSETTTPVGTTPAVLAFKDNGISGSVSVFAFMAGGGGTAVWVGSPVTVNWMAFGS